MLLELKVQLYSHQTCADETHARDDRPTHDRRRTLLSLSLRLPRCLIATSPTLQFATRATHHLFHISSPRSSTESLLVSPTGQKPRGAANGGCSCIHHTSSKPNVASPNPPFACTSASYLLSSHLSMAAYLPAVFDPLWKLQFTWLTPFHLALADSSGHIYDCDRIHAITAGLSWNSNAARHSSLSHGQPFARAHCRMARWPFRAA